MGSVQRLPFVRSLAEALRQLGQQPFYDETALSPGEPYQRVLSEGLRKADAIVFILSRHSLESKYVLTELGAALGYFDERGRPNPIPVVIDDSELPPQVSHIQAIFARGRAVDDVAIEIAGALEHIAGRAQAKAEKKQEVQQRIESNAAEFIEKSLKELKERESSYRKLAYTLYSVAYVFLVAALAIALWRASTLPSHVTTWLSLAAYGAVGVLILGLVVAVARFAFMLAKSFMVEALRTSDRIHAISFGEFYLKAFPDGLDWEHVKEAFQHWNIDKGSDFLAQKPADFDHEIFKTALSLAETIKSAKAKKDD